MLQLYDVIIKYKECSPITDSFCPWGQTQFVFIIYKNEQIRELSEFFHQIRLYCVSSFEDPYTCPTNKFSYSNQNTVS